MKIYGIAMALAATLLVSCSRDEDATRGGGRRELAVNVQMASSDWTTRSGGGSAAEGTYDRTHEGTQVLGSAALDEQLEIVAECGTQDAPETPGTPEYGTSEALTPETPLTRGTPIGSVSSLKSLGFAVYTNSVFTKNCTATNNGGSWNIADNITLDLDKNKYSYYAYAPAAVAADNGIVLQADGKKLTYTAPDDITKQPDLCWAAPILNDPTGSATFGMQHALTAIGVKVRAANVEIKSIKLLGVNTSGTLDLTSGAWGGVGTPKSLTFQLLTTTPPDTGDGVADLIASDGYLMLPPQALIGDGKKLEIVYRYTTGSDLTEHTGTHKLSDITGNEWAAGQKVNYVIQLKSNFSLTLSPASASVQYTAGKYEFGYTTGSPLPSIDPQVTDDVDWITGYAIDRVNRKISFNYTQNTSLSIPRQATIRVTSGFTTQNFAFKQLVDPWIKISAKSTPDGYTYRNGGSYTIDVETPPGVAWKAANAAYECTVTPAGGSGGRQSVRITIGASTVDRYPINVVFSTDVRVAGITEKTDKWSVTQSRVPEGFSPQNLLGRNVYVYMYDTGVSSWSYARTDICPRLTNVASARLPTRGELQAIYANKSKYGWFQDGYYWWFDWPPVGQLNMGNGSWNTYNTGSCTVRCVLEF